MINGPVTIDGYSEPGARQATRTTPADLMIEIDASAVGRGIEVGDDVEVRGVSVHSAQFENVFVEGRRSVVAGSHIGTNRTGDSAVQYEGANVAVYGNRNLIGGPRVADRNVIAGRSIDVYVANGAHEIENNRIGTNAQGTADLGFGYGIWLLSPRNVVRANLISGFAIGIEITSDQNMVKGNRVGTNAEGTASIPNGDGINIEGGDHNTIGGNGSGDGNLISGNDYAGIQIEYGDDPPEEEIGPAVGNEVRGNLIGTDWTGSAPLGNGSTFGLPGVLISGADANSVGGYEPGAGNVIAANAGNGIDITSGVGNRVLGNAIGTNTTGLPLGLGNGKSGIRIRTDDNQIGDTFGAPNTIAYNGEDGITIDAAAARNTLVRNLIFVNGTGDDDLGIDLADDGATANDDDDLDTGPNDLLNFPVATAADGQSGIVEWTLSGLALTDYRLEFYASTTCPGGIGEGQRYLGSVNASTDDMGDAAGATATTTPPATGEHVTMTATRRTVVGPFPSPLTDELWETSEFSPCQVAG